MENRKKLLSAFDGEGHTNGIEMPFGLNLMAIYNCQPTEKQKNRWIYASKLLVI